MFFSEFWLFDISITVKKIVKVLIVPGSVLYVVKSIGFYEIKQTATNLPEYKNTKKSTKSERFAVMTRVHRFRS